MRSVAVPAEHGGWSLTLEPALLGLIVEPSWAGLCLAGAGLTAFLARTPAKIALIDRRRGRVLPRTRPAAWIGTAEIAVLISLVVAASALALAPFWWPLAAASPLVALELWYDIRSRSRRLVPELAGSVGVASIAAAVALAGGASDLLAGGLWLIAGARAAATIPFVRVQLRRAKDHAPARWHSDVAQVLVVMAVAMGRSVEAVSTPALVAIIILALMHGGLVRSPVPRAAVIGAQQVVLGLAVVLTAGLGAIAP